MSAPDFLAHLQFLPAEQSGRTTPARSGYRPLIVFEHYPEYPTSGEQTYLDKTEVFPGDSVQAEIKILGAGYFTKRLDAGRRFQFYEGSVLIGYGAVTQIVNPDLLKNETLEERNYNLNLFSPDIRERIFADFGEDRVGVIQQLQKFLLEHAHIRSERIIRAIIYVADKKATGISKAIKDAGIDGRDVLMAAEYENRSELQPKRVRDFNRKFGEEDL